MGSFVRGVTELTVAPGSDESFWIVDVGWSSPAGQVVVCHGAAQAYECPLVSHAGPVRVRVSVWSGPPPGDVWGDRPFYSPSGVLAVEASGVRGREQIGLDGPGLYWVVSHPVQAHGDGLPPTQEVQIWPVPDQLPAGTPLFPGEQPWRVAEGVVGASYGEFWVHAGEWWNEPGSPLVPEGGVLRARDRALAVPTVVGDTDVGVVLSVWQQDPPPAAGSLLGECRIRTGDGERQLRVSAVNDVPDMTLDLPGAGEYAVWVWRRLEPGETFEYERYDVRLHRCPRP